MRNKISEKLKNFEMHENPTLQAYYYGFDRTGVKVIDSILSAVAMAGKGYHNTDCWSDVCDFLGFSYTELIQEMANRAAKERDDLRAQNAELPKIETNQKENGKMNKIEIGTILTDKNGGKRKVLGIDDYGDATVSVLNNYGVEGHKMNLSIIQSAGGE